MTQYRHRTISIQYCWRTVGHFGNDSHSITVPLRRIASIWVSQTNSNRRNISGATKSNVGERSTKKKTVHINIKFPVVYPLSVTLFPFLISHIRDCRQSRLTVSHVSGPLHTSSSHWGINGPLKFTPRALLSRIHGRRSIFRRVFHYLTVFFSYI